MKLPASASFLSLLCAATFAAGAFAPSTVRAQTAEATTAKTADLSGAFSDFKLDETAKGRYKLGGKVTVKNLSDAVAKNVRVNFYLSTDAELDPEDLVHTVQLSTYNEGNGKLKGNHQIEIPLKQKVVALIGSLLRDQYLIVEVVADNAVSSADHHNIVVVGPIKVP